MAARQEDVKEFNNYLIGPGTITFQDVAQVLNSPSAPRWSKQKYQRALRWGLVVELAESYVTSGWLAGSQSVIAILASQEDDATFMEDPNNLKSVSCFITDGMHRLTAVSNLAQEEQFELMGINFSDCSLAQTRADWWDMMKDTKIPILVYASSVPDQLLINLSLTWNEVANKRGANSNLDEIDRHFSLFNNLYQETVDYIKALHGLSPGSALRSWSPYLYEYAKNRFQRYLNTQGAQTRIKSGNLTDNPEAIFQDVKETSCVAKSAFYPSVFFSSTNARHKTEKQSHFVQILLGWVMMGRLLVSSWPADRDSDFKIEWHTLGEKAQLSCPMSNEELISTRKIIDKYKHLLEKGWERIGKYEMQPISNMKTLNELPVGVRELSLEGAAAKIVNLDTARRCWYNDMGLLPLHLDANLYDETALENAMHQLERAIATAEELAAINSAEVKRKEEEERAKAAKAALEEKEQVARLQKAGYTIVSSKPKPVASGSATSSSSSGADASSSQSSSSSVIDARKGTGRPKGSLGQRSLGLLKITPEVVDKVLGTLVFSQPCTWEIITGQEEREAAKNKLGGTSSSKMPDDPRVFRGFKGPESESTVQCIIADPPYSDPRYYTCAYLQDLLNACVKMRNGVANGALCLYFGKMTYLGRLLTELDDVKNAASKPRGWEWDRNIQLLVKGDFDKRSSNWSKCNSDSFIILKRDGKGKGTVRHEALKAWSGDMSTNTAINSLLAMAGYPEVNSPVPPMSHVTFGFKPLTGKQLLKDPHTRKPLRQGMQSNPGSTAYLLLKYTSRGALVFFPFAGTLGEVMPCLRLGRRVLASECDAATHRKGMEALREEIKLHLAGEVDLTAIWEEGKKLSDDGVLAQKGKDFLRGLQELPFAQDWLFNPTLDLSAQEKLFCLVTKDISFDDVRRYAPDNSKKGLTAFEQQWGKCCEKAWNEEGGAGKERYTMRGLFNNHLEVQTGDYLAIVDGFFVRKSEAKGRHKGYLNLDGYPQFDNWVFEINEENPALYANDAKGPIQMQTKRQANASFVSLSLDMSSSDRRPAEVTEIFTKLEERIRSTHASSFEDAKNRRKEGLQRLNDIKTTMWDGERDTWTRGCFGLIAKRKIKPYAQIFIDYGPEYWAYEEAGSDTEYDEENDREEEEGEEVEAENQEQAVENEDIDEEDDEEGPDAAAGDQDDAQMEEEPAAEEDAAQEDDNNPGLVASFLNDSEGDAGADLDSEDVDDSQLNVSTQPAATFSPGGEPVAGQKRKTSSTESPGSAPPVKKSKGTEAAVQERPSIEPGANRVSLRTNKNAATDPNIIDLTTRGLTRIPPPKKLKIPRQTAAAKAAKTTAKDPGPVEEAVAAARGKPRGSTSTALGQTPSGGKGSKKGDKGKGGRGKKRNK